MKKQFVIFLAVLVILVFAGLCYLFQKRPVVVEIRGHRFNLELATDEEEREKGLSGRENLCQECGMLFVFPEKGSYPFWMKDMQFDLDIIWLDDGKIVYMAKNVLHDKKATIRPERSADRVLEINAGLSDRYGLKEGDQAIFSY